MTFRKSLFFKAFATLCCALSSSAQRGFDPFAIYQGNPVPSFPRNSGTPKPGNAGLPRFRSEEPQRNPQRFEDTFLKGGEGIQPYSSNFFVGKEKKSHSSLPKDEGDDFREKFRFDDDHFGPPSRPRPQYLDSRPNRHHYSRPKQGRRPQEDEGRDKPLSVYQASSDTPMIFAFRLNRKFWDEKLRHRVNSLRRVNFVDDMEGYAKPSMQIGYRLMEWFRGLRGGADSKKVDPLLVTKTSATSTVTAKSSEKTEIDPPVYYSHYKSSSTEVIRDGGGSGKRGVVFPPVAFSASPDFDHSLEHYANHRHNPANEIPLGKILKASAGKGRPNFNPKCNKGGSMIFCNSDALMGLLDLLEEHMQKSEKHFDGRDPNLNNDDQYKSNLKFPGSGTDEHRQPMRIEVIEMDPNQGPNLNNGGSGKPKGSNDFNELHDVDHVIPAGPYDYGGHHETSGYGHDDPNKEIEVVIVVHTKSGSYAKSIRPNTNLGHYGGSYGGGYKDPHPHDVFRKPYKEFDDDVDQNNYDRKFERLKKVIDIVRQRNNKIGAGNEGYDNHYRGHQYGRGYDQEHREGDGRGYDQDHRQGEEHRLKGDDYWDSLLDEHQFGHYIPLQNTKNGPSQVHPEVEEDPHHFGGGPGLYVDMTEGDLYSYGRERNPDRQGRNRQGRIASGEQFFGLARAGKSKHATQKERIGAIRTKIEQVYFKP